MVACSSKIQDVLKQKKRSGETTPGSPLFFCLTYRPMMVMKARPLLRALTKKARDRDVTGPIN